MHSGPPVSQAALHSVEDLQSLERDGLCQSLQVPVPHPWVTPWSLHLSGSHLPLLPHLCSIRLLYHPSNRCTSQEMGL